MTAIDAAGKEIVVAIAGNPNTGKTTILNALVGTNFTVGNWPGVTVEKKEGALEYDGVRLRFVDLPGIYTLEPVSDDERVSRDYLTNERPHVILNVVETPNLLRNLGLTIELTEFGVPMVVALNMADEARAAGMRVDAGLLGEMLGARALPTIGRTGAGVRDLLPALLHAARDGRPPQRLGGDGLADEQRRERRREFAAEIFQRAVRRDDKPPTRAARVTRALDRVLLHPVAGLAIYAAVLYAFFKISFDFSAPYMDWLDGLFSGYLGPLAMQTLNAIGAPEIVGRFVSEAVLGGFAFVLTFLPLIAVMYFFLTLLGMSGYMARLPFLLDRFMGLLGLNGKAIIPLLLGLGCNVPAIMAMRTLESRRDKMLVALMIPFISCPARLVVFSFFAALFFPNPALVIMGLYAFGVVVAVATSFFVQKRMFRGDPALLVMELPPYRLPRLHTVGVIVWSHVKEFLTRAGTTIFGVSVGVWLLVHVPFGAKPQDSVVAWVGKAITPVFAPIGLDDWRATTSLIPAFLAREVALSFMATIYAAEDAAPPAHVDAAVGALEQARALGEAALRSAQALVDVRMQTFNVGEIGDSALRTAVAQTFTPPAALAFMLLLLLYNSCLAVYGVMAKELGARFANTFMLYSFAVGWAAAFVAYRVGMLLA
jgi:ferrous iron transport protein B